MKVAVCGGRDFNHYGMVCGALNAVHKKHGVTLIIHGGCSGADQLSAEWAEGLDIPTRAYPADWEKHGRKAGPLRNQEMIDHGKPDALVAFPGGRGTADMVARAKTANIPIWEIAIEMQGN